MTIKRLIPFVAAAILAAAVPAAGLVHACDKAKAETTTASADKGGCAKPAAATTAEVKTEGTGCPKAAATTASAGKGGCAGKAEGKGCAKAKEAALTAEAKPAETPATSTK